MQHLIDIFLHLDDHLNTFVGQYGPWIYGLLFVIVFCETGLVVTPFLPGDSLLFAVGALVASDILHPIIFPILFVAAILGNTCNYWIGRRIGPRVFKHDQPLVSMVDTSANNDRRGAPVHSEPVRIPIRAKGVLARLLNKKHLDRAHVFFEHHGGKAVMLGQFLPIVRTFVPFVAGAGAMNYPKFVFFNVVGAAMWVGVCGTAGYFFGNWEPVKENFSLVVLGIVGVSLLPVFVQIVRSRFVPVSRSQT